MKESRTFSVHRISSQPQWLWHSGSSTTDTLFESDLPYSLHRVSFVLFLFSKQLVCWGQMAAPPTRRTALMTPLMTPLLTPFELVLTRHSISLFSLRASSRNASRISLSFSFWRRENYRLCYEMDASTLELISLHRHLCLLFWLFPQHIPFYIS